ncbi:hypothetical protein IE4771_PB00018 (plasmid) [Rhizobium etli bv. mimosae str. IE4771]|uniref:Uncharacterized protein n=1 Tax=Rhizobium etli bv. mimosae str. IE4771 TaxID=1432050 RepID=A0A060I3N2_RHIET|nr:hypothetical protein [Rhizobium sp. IE4771]AIC29753.1 hypothetical protein IE4771_PB00018 [Rhizobium sp. IE4771]
MTLFHNQEELQKYDLLVPLDIPEKAGFVGKSSRGSIALNGEIGFSFNGWEASFHRLENHAYIIVRVNCEKHEIDEKLATVRCGLAWAGVKLDISMRPLSAPLVYLSIGGRADLAKISAFPAGEVPLASVKWSSYSIELPVSMLSEAIDNSAQIDVVHEALRIFADVDSRSA